MEIRLNLFGVLSTIFIFPNYAEGCECTPGLQPSFSVCPTITAMTGTVCYGSATANSFCAEITCAGTTHTATCKDNNGHGTWSSSYTTLCHIDTTPSMHTASKNINTTTPSMHTQSESINTTTPSMHTQSETINTTTPSMHTQSESINTTTPSMHTASESINTTTPSMHTQSESINTTTDNEVPSTSSASTPTINDTNTTPISNTSLEATSENAPTISTSHSLSTIENTQTTDPQDNLTSKEQPSSEKEKHENIVVIVTVPIGIVVVIIIVIIVFILWRRKTRSKGAAVIKPRLHGAISNNLYQNPTSNGNIIPMNNLAPATTDNGYVGIFDDKPTPIDTSDSSYNTISLPNESGNTYGHLKPVTQPFVDNTYSHMNKTQMQMGAVYSHIGTASEQTKQPVSIDDNTYSHIGKGTYNAKMKQQTVDSGDTYSHIGKKAAIPIIKQQTAETDDTYSHIGKGFNPHHKTADADSGDTYNTLGIMPNVSLQNNDETNDDSEYNHLTSGLQSTSKSSDSQKKDDAFSCYRQKPSSGVTGSSTSDQYAQVGKKDTYEIIDNIEVNTDNEKTSNCFFVVDEDNEESTTQCDTDGGQVNHQYFILEKHERQL